MADKLKLLIVDDSDDYRENIKEILEIKNYNVVTAPDGETAIGKVKNEDIDLVLMDVKMPVMSGLEAYKKIKKLKPQLPVIMISAFAVEDLIKKSLKRGAYGYISKPIDFEKLFNMINNATEMGGIIHVMDNDEEICSDIESYLKKEGYRVFKARSKDEALEIVETHKPDIILLDMELSPINGLDIYLEIRERRPQAIVILLSSYPEKTEEKLSEILNGSFLDVLEKPIDMDEMLKLIKKIEKKVLS
ncbi:MAG: response regulator [Candidatus Cloacimonetes bacterium]|nr:response regulator [Candidatus Cloacimonadota bacterium]